MLSELGYLLKLAPCLTFGQTNTLGCLCLRHTLGESPNHRLGDFIELSECGIRIVQITHHPADTPGRRVPRFSVPLRLLPINHGGVDPSFTFPDLLAVIVEFISVVQTDGAVDLLEMLLFEACKESLPYFTDPSVQRSLVFVLSGSNQLQQADNEIC